MKPDARFQMSLFEPVHLRQGRGGFENTFENADGIRGKVSTVGLAAPEEKWDEIAIQLARWGATRICPLGQMQNPPLFWRHDGRPALGDLVTWTIWKMINSPVGRESCDDGTMIGADAPVWYHGNIISSASQPRFIAGLNKM